MAPPRAEVSQETRLRNKIPIKSVLSVSQCHLQGVEINYLQNRFAYDVSGSLDLPAVTLMVVGVLT